jgi:hypothetical protein
MPNFTQNQLRAVAGIVLLILALVYIYKGSSNNNIEIIMIALTGSLVGYSIFPQKTKE